MIPTVENLKKCGYKKYGKGWRHSYDGSYYSDRTIDFPDFIINFGKYKGKNLKKAIDEDEKYWAWFAYNVKIDTPHKRNILRYMCCLAYDLSCSVNAEAGFLREHRKFIEEYGYEYEKEAIK